MFLLFFTVFVVDAQTLHMFIVTQQDDNIGAPVDKETMKALADEIRTNVPSLDIKIKTINGADASESRIFSEIDRAGAGNNDIIWYYYSGHGLTYDGWPMSDQGEVPLTTVHKKLKTTNARLTLAMYDCCNVDDPIADPPSDLRAKSAYYKLLFLTAKGNIISASCSTSELSFGHPAAGGVYTNAFIDAIRTEASWKDIMIATKRMTKTNAQKEGRSQIPIYDIQNYTTEQMANAPSYRTKRYNKLEKLAISVSKTYRISYNGKEDITIFDIMHWNPGVTEANFKDFKKLEIKFEDKVVGRTR